MARRLYKTTADYLAIAVTPALIMALVTSLVFFLLLVFYEGEWRGRLQYIMFLFIFAAVLIARIAIEEGRERAMMFSVLLGGATAFVVSRFSDLHMAVNLALLGLIWWCSDRLTWDCTLIDEHENASGEGLLQTVGLDEPSAEPQSAKAQADVEPLGVTSREHPVEEKTWWRRAWEHFHKARSPGVWVVYFSLAALPIFGFGQKFISSDEARSTGFRYLFIYVASALGLLLATCFLGLRRYLRQRQIDMPDKMAAVWVATGCALIAGLLLICTILPRRNPVLEIAQNAPPISFGSPSDLKPSRWGWGDEGIKDDSQSGTAEIEAQKQGGGESEKNSSDNSDGQSGESSDQKGGGQTNQQGEESKQQGSGSQEGGQSQQQGGANKSQSQSGQSQSDAKQQGKSSSGKQQQSNQGEQSSGDNPSQGQSANQQNQNNNSTSGDSPQKQSQANQGPSKQNGEQSGANSQEQQNGGQPPGDAAQQQGAPKSPDPAASGQSQSQPQEPPKSGSQPPPSREPPNQPQQAQARPQPQPQRQEQQSSSPPRQSFNPGSFFGSLFGWLGTLLRLAFYVVLVIIGIWLFRKYKDDLLAGFRELFGDLRKLWERLLGRKPTAAPIAEAPRETGPVYRPFSDYPDPFASAAAGRYTPEQLVKYSFEAFEAWARERGCPRHPEQTPHEFAQEIGARNSTVSRPARALADLYSRLAYGPGSLPASSVDHVKQLWSALRS
jgi:hypothetical protein